MRWLALARNALNCARSALSSNLDSRLQSLPFKSASIDLSRLSTLPPWKNYVRLRSQPSSGCQSWSCLSLCFPTSSWPVAPYMSYHFSYALQRCTSVRRQVVKPNSPRSSKRLASEPISMQSHHLAIVETKLIQKVINFTDFKITEIDEKSRNRWYVQKFNSLLTQKNNYYF